MKQIENKTDKDLLVKGIKTMFLTAFLMFVGPTLIYIALSNKDKSTHLFILIVAILICILAVYFGFKGIKTIMDSMFKKSKN